MTSHPHEKYIITDIDGTVVPHPYHSGLTQSERNPYITKLLHLMRNHHVACVTGRTLHGWKRLWTDSGNDPHLPRLMGLSFGAEVYFHGKALPVTPNSHELEQATHELRAALDASPEFRNQADTADVMSKGRLQGYSIEVKPRIVQIDWNFATQNALFWATNCMTTTSFRASKRSNQRCLAMFAASEFVKVTPRCFIMQTKLWKARTRHGNSLMPNSKGLGRKIGDCAVRH